MLKRLRKWLQNDRSIMRGALVLGSGAALGQLVGILATPVISRLYSPAEMGFFALYFSFVSVAVTISPLGFQQALPSASNKDEASLLAAGVILIQPVMCLLLAVVQWALIHFDYLGFGALPVAVVWLTGFSIFASTLLTTLQFWFIREELYQVISRVQVMQNIGRAGLQTALGAIGMGVFGLVIGDFGGRWLGLSGMLRRAFPELKRAVRDNTFRDFLAVFGKFRKFLFPQLPSIVINTVARMLPVPLLVHYYGVEAAGLYAMADRVMKVPVGFVSKSFGNALHGRIGVYSRTNPKLIMGVFLKSSGSLFLVGLLPTLLVVFWGETIFRTVLGGQWGEAGQIGALLAPLALAMLVVSTTSRVVYIFQAFGTAFLYNFTALTITIGVFWFGSHQGWDVLRTVTWLSRLGVLGYAFYYVLLLIIVRRGIGELEVERDGVDVRPEQ